MTARQLREAEQRTRRLNAQHAEAVAARDAAIREALAGGWTQRAVANVTGLTPGRIGQIASR